MDDLHPAAHAARGVGVLPAQRVVAGQRAVHPPEDVRVALPVRTARVVHAQLPVHREQGALSVGVGGEVLVGAPRVVFEFTRIAFGVHAFGVFGTLEHGDVFGGRVLHVAGEQ